MIGWPARLVKVCGLRQPEHALAAAQAGANCLGVILAPGRRRISPAEAHTLAARVKQSGQLTALVGVFVNEQPALINQLAATIGLDIVQLSGDEPASIISKLALPILKAIRLTGDEQEREWLEQASQRPDQLRLLVDAHVSGSYGGAGVHADWQRAAAVAQRYPLVLAGGLSAQDVADAIHAVQPWGVDVSSGVETAGVKSIAKIDAFVKHALHAFEVGLH